jgi:hypothetical protein
MNYAFVGTGLLYIRSASQKLHKSSNGQHVAAPASTLKQRHRPLPRPGASSLREAPDEFGKYQFQVVARSITDAVMSIGGLIFDRAMAGWDVSVVVDGEIDGAVDDRPVRILGARLAERMSGSNYAAALPRPQILAVATDVMVKSDAVRRHVLALGDTTEIDVLLWGRHHPTNFPRAFAAARHQPSAAAHIFKSHALLAVGAQATPRADEGFYSMA